MTLIDVHAHNYLSNYENSANSKVIIIENGIDSETNQKCLNYSKSHSNIKVAMGFHPTSILSESDLNSAIKEIAVIKSNKDKIVAIGEIGLDYFHNKEEEIKGLQKKVFKEYLQLASDLSLPVIIHARNAVKDVLEILEEVSFDQNVIMHCMEASKKNIKLAVDRGYFFTIPASVERNEQFQWLVELSSVSKMLTETDSPYQGPEKGVPAKPEDVQVAINYIANKKELDSGEVENMIFMNYLKVF